MGLRDSFAQLLQRDLSPRVGDWMQTYSGAAAYPMDPRPEDFSPLDIAHALGMKVRYNGHCIRFYSVAEHSVLMAQNVSRRNRLWALLHDASEAYTGDAIRPIKPHLAGYKSIEAKVMRAICDRFDLPHQMPAEIKLVDDAILLDEQQQNMTHPPMPWKVRGNALGVTLQFWSPERAEHEFLAALAGAGGI